MAEPGGWATYSRLTPPSDSWHSCWHGDTGPDASRRRRPGTGGRAGAAGTGRGAADPGWSGRAVAPGVPGQDVRRAGPERGRPAAAGHARRVAADAGGQAAAVPDRGQPEAAHLAVVPVAAVVGGGPDQPGDLVHRLGDRRQAGLLLADLGGRAVGGGEHRVGDAVSPAPAVPVGGS